MIAVTEVNSFDELASLRVTWKQLWQETGDASFVQSWEWLRSYWRLFGDDLKLRALVVTLAAKPIGIVPFALRPVKTKLGMANVLTWPQDDWGVCHGQIGRNPAAALAAAMRHIIQTRDWDAIELSGIDRSRVDRGRTRSAMQTCGIQPSVTDTLEYPVVQIEGSWDWYLEERGLEPRVQLTRAQQELDQHGPVSFHRWRPVGGRNGETERRWDLFQTFADIKRATACGTHQAEIELALLKDVHPVAVDAGAVDIATLTVNGRAVACCYSYISHETVEVAFVGAHDPAGESATTVLIGNMIRDSFMRDDQRIIFRRDDGPALSAWTSNSLATVTLSHIPRLSARGQLLKRARRTSRNLTRSTDLLPGDETNHTAGPIGICAGS
jgi:CelD/BcsL family acetyltransferase involved in cellulose biosynthesis